MISVLRNFCICPGFAATFGVGLAPRVLMQWVDLVQMVGKLYGILAPLYDLRACGKDATWRNCCMSSCHTSFLLGVPLLATLFEPILVMFRFQPWKHQKWAGDSPTHLFCTDSPSGCFGKGPDIFERIPLAKQCRDCTLFSKISVSWGVILQLEYLSTSGNGTGKFQAANTSPSGLLFKHETWCVSKTLKIPHNSYVIRGSLNNIFRIFSKKKGPENQPSNFGHPSSPHAPFFRLSKKNLTSPPRFKWCNFGTSASRLGVA